jgi:O-antigen/teichoic acid export membrane protein
MRTTLKVSVLLALPMAVGVFVLAGPLLRLFGSDYAEQATWCLRLLGLGVFPMIVKNHYVTLLRIDQQIESNAAFMLTCATFEVVLPAIAIGLGGLTGLSLAWLIAVSVEAALMSPRVFQTAAFSFRRTPFAGESAS